MEVEDALPDALELTHVALPLTLHASIEGRWLGVGLGDEVGVGLGVGVGSVLNEGFKAPPMRLMDFSGGFI